MNTEEHKVTLEIKFELQLREAQSLLMLLRQEEKHGFRRRGEEALTQGVLDDIRRFHHNLEQILWMR